MREPSGSRPPSLVVVTGRPGSGKTSLTHRLAPAIPCPLVSRDEIKEGLQVHHPELDEEAAKLKAYEAFFATLEGLLGRGVTVVAEAAFQHRLWEEPLARLGRIARVRIVVLSIPPELALERRIARLREDPSRERFHPDPGIAALRSRSPMPDEAYDPPHLDVPTLTIDASDGYAPGFTEIVAFARE